MWYEVTFRLRVIGLESEICLERAARWPYVPDSDMQIHGLFVDEEGRDLAFPIQELYADQDGGNLTAFLEPLTLGDDDRMKLAAERMMANGWNVVARGEPIV